MAFELGTDPKNDTNTVILDKDKRIVASWGTVQVRDREGQILSIQDVIKNLKAMEERGGGSAPIHFDRRGGHGNKRVGKTIEQIPWRINKDGRDIPGVIVVYQIYKGDQYGNYRIDDEAWELIEKNEITGLSLGGEAYGGGKVCSVDNPSNCAEILKDIEDHEWTLARQPVNELARNITKSEFRKIVDELTLAGYDTSRVTNIAKSFVTVREDKFMAEDDKKVEEFAKSVQEGLDKIGERITAIEKDVQELKKESAKKDEDKDDKKKEAVCKDEPKVDPATSGPEAITKEDIKELFKEYLPTLVSEEIKKTMAGTGTATSDKPGTGATAPAQPKTVQKDTPQLQEPLVGQDPKDIAKDGGKKKTKVPHPSKGIVKHDNMGVPQYA